MPKIYKVTLESTTGTDDGMVFYFDITTPITIPPPPPSTSHAGESAGLLLALTKAA